MASYDLPLQQGATYRVIFTWKDASDVPINLGGRTARMQLRKKAGGELLSDLSSSDPTAAARLIKTDATGEIEVYIGATVTATLPATGVYDLELHSDTDPNEVVRLVEGTFTCSRQVTLP